jgi:hypothetical protein
MNKGTYNKGDERCLSRIAVLLRKKQVLLASVMRKLSSVRCISSRQSIMINKMW